MNDCQLISIAKPLYELCYGWMTLNLHWSWDGLEIVDDGHYYRPQQSCEGYVFTGGWGCLLQCMLWYHPARVKTPPEESDPPRADTPQEQTPPWQTPPWQTPPKNQTPTKKQTPPRDMTTAADGTHPTGMHSFLSLLSLCSLRSEMRLKLPYSRTMDPEHEQLPPSWYSSTGG